MSQRTSSWRRTLIVLGVIAAAAAAGYVTTCAVFPAPIVSRQVEVPALRGQGADAALAQLTTLGLRGRVADTTADPLASAGTIAWQSPVAQTMLPPGAIVRLGVSSGAPGVVAPDVVDLDIGLARQVIDAAGLHVGRVDTLQHDGAFGTVLAMSPPAGSNARVGDTIGVTISSGPPAVPVPNVVGLTVSAARDRLAAAGLRVGALEQRFEGKAGTILAQRPAPGELVTRESGVNLTISGTMP